MPSRRVFLRTSLTASGGLVIGGCGGAGGLGDDDDDSPIDVPDPACAAIYDSGTFLETLPFENDGTADDDLETPLGPGTGHDARLVTDLRRVDEDRLVVDVEDFFVRTESPDLLPPTDGWTIAIRGLVDEEVDLPLNDLLADEIDLGPVVLECSGNGSSRNFGLLSACDWSGIPFASILDRVTPSAGATRVLINGFDERTQVSSHSDPGASWIFTFDELADFGAVLATKMNGQPLTPDHGFPVRLLVPRWYGCACVKWVDEIRFVGDDEPATSQMQEFAARTHQDGTPALARDYIAASMDTAAMPVRVEKWELAGEIVYRVVGIVWGGDELAPPISLGGGGDDDWQAVTFCPDREDVRTWGLWWTTWRPQQAGFHTLTCRVDDPTVRTRRLDVGRYDRDVLVDEV